MRKIKPVTVSIGHIRATARNKTEARKLLWEKVEAVLSGSYDPTVLFYRGLVGVVWREPSDGMPWWYTIVEEGKDHTGDYRTLVCADTQKEAERELRRWLAQYAWRPEDGTAVPDIIVDKDDRAEFVHLAELWLESLRQKEGGEYGS